MASTEHEHSLNIRAFKWAAELFIEKQDGADETSNRNPANLLILMRASIGGATASEVIAVPYYMKQMNETKFLAVLVRTMKLLSILGSYENLDRLASDLMYTETALKFGRFGRCDRLWKKSDPNNVLVLFFDLKINQVVRMKKKDLKDIEPMMISHLKVNAEMNLENVEEIEECLKVCPGMVVVAEPKGMTEIKGFVDITVFNEETEAECPICLGNISVGYRFATTTCSHRFHKKCLNKWLVVGKDSCPLCRSVVAGSEAERLRHRHHRRRHRFPESMSYRLNYYRPMMSVTDSTPDPVLPVHMAENDELRRQYHLIVVLRRRLLRDSMPPDDAVPSYGLNRYRPRPRTSVRNSTPATLPTPP